MPTKHKSRGLPMLQVSIGVGRGDLHAAATKAAKAMGLKSNVTADNIELFADVLGDIVDTMIDEMGGWSQVIRDHQSELEDEFFAVK